MNDDNRKQYWEGLCNRTSNMYSSYNQMRQFSFTFGLSLGALLMAQGSDYVWAGFTIMFVQMGWFVWISSQVVNQWLYSRNIDLWLHNGNTNRSFDSDYRMNIPSYYNFLFHKLPEKDEIKDAEVVDGSDWREVWLNILASRKNIEERNMAIHVSTFAVVLSLILVIPSLS